MRTTFLWAAAMAVLLCSLTAFARVSPNYETTGMDDETKQRLENIFRLVAEYRGVEAPASLPAIVFRDPAIIAKFTNKGGVTRHGSQGALITQAMKREAPSPIGYDIALSNQLNMAHPLDAAVAGHEGFHWFDDQEGILSAMSEDERETRAENLQRWLVKQLGGM